MPRPASFSGMPGLPEPSEMPTVAAALRRVGRVEARRAIKPKDLISLSRHAASARRFFFGPTRRAISICHQLQAAVSWLLTAAIFWWRAILRP